MIIFLKVLLSVVFVGAVAALLLFMLVFPLVNKKFGKKLPAFHYGEERPVKQKTAKKRAAPRNTRARARVRANGKKSSAARKLRNTPAAGARPAAQRAVDFHKDIPTVRIDTLFTGEVEKTLTLSKISAEGKQAIAADAAKSPAPSADIAPPKKRAAKTVAIPTAAPPPQEKH
ncbi:MAG: hypothetical protein FWH03_01600 [Firmicutes bacterium]|nr:hypothetical protein [Bacillota bacterium]